MLVEGLIFVVVLFAAYQAYAVQLERKRAIKLQQELLAAIMAKDVGQYLQAIDALRRTPDDKLREMKLENDLAQAAVKLEEQQGFPVS